MDPDLCGGLPAVIPHTSVDRDASRTPANDQARASVRANSYGATMSSGLGPVPDKRSWIDTGPALRMSGVSKRYGVQWVLRDVSLSVEPAEVHALLGENGAGKSTLIKIIAGVVVPDRGTVAIGSTPLCTGSVPAAHRLGVYYVSQELSLVPDWTVSENLMLADQKLGRPWRRREALSRTRELLDGMLLDSLDPAEPVRNLSLNQRQMLEVARAAAAKPKVLLLDEASSSLPGPDVTWLFNLVRELKNTGTAVVFVSHRINEVMEIADRITILRDGEVVGAMERETFDPQVAIELMAGQPVSDVFPEPKREVTPAAPVRPLLKVADLRTQHVRGVDVSIDPGEIVGLAGLEGHGQAELLKALFGVVPVKAQQWEFNGRPVRRLDPHRAVKLGIGFVPESRQIEGLALDLTIGENLLAPWLTPAGPGGRLAIRRNVRWIKTVLGRLAVKDGEVLSPVASLSGGNQQKVVVGRWLDRGCQLLLLHDPTRGIDVRSKYEIYSVLRDFAANSGSVLWLSTDTDELVGMCDRVLVMYEGKASALLKRRELSVQAVVNAMMGRR